ncbi:MAG TPA: hypothetical protein VLE89_05045 [Chlamydiales bacterium]|nr:hypothetical protein [Chlamydiales bacterium]
MGLKRIFILTLSFFFVLWGYCAFTGENPRVTAQVEELDRRIAELEDMKRGFEARALRHESQAEYLQFDDRAYLETRRHWQLAEENRMKAAKVQEEIDKLQAKKEKLVH